MYLPVGEASCRDSPGKRGNGSCGWRKVKGKKLVEGGMKRAVIYHTGPRRAGQHSSGSEANFTGTPFHGLINTRRTNAVVNCIYLNIVSVVNYMYTLIQGEIPSFLVQCL